MKNFVFLCLALLCASLTGLSQAPQSIPYQAVARDAQGHLLANQAVSVRFSIHDLSASGSVVYAETHAAITSPLGLFTLNLGEGSPNSGVFSEIAWGSGSKFLQIELDATNSGNYSDMGTSQLLSVPYALYAERAGNANVQMNFFFADRDGDGLGDKFSAYYGPYALSQYVEDSTDCNDLLPYPQGVYFYFTDIDGDGFGDPGTGFESCTELNGGFVDNDGDCSIDDPSQPMTLFFDNDGDGFGGEQSSLICDNDDPQWVSITGDCNDNDANAFPGQFCSDCDAASAQFIAANQAGILQQGGFCIVFEGAQSSEDLQICLSNAFPEIGSACLPCLADYVYCTFTNCIGECMDVNGTCWQCQVENGCIDALELCIGVSDQDGDGWFAPTDCNDNNPNINPFGSEICDGIDNNCDGQVDPTLLYFFDNDGDGFGDDNNFISSCEPVSGYIEFSGDCDDNDASINPVAAELCDQLDNNCNGTIDDANVFYADFDQDGFGDDFNASLGCDGLEGYVVIGGDCDDSDASINPAANDLCGDGVDSNCDGTENIIELYVDADGDGYGDAASGSLFSCEIISGYSTIPGDCDDQDSSVYPGNGCETSACTGNEQVFTELNYNAIINEGASCFNLLGFDQTVIVDCLLSSYPEMGEGCATCVYEGLSCLFIDCANACNIDPNNCQSCYDTSPCWDSMNACLGIGNNGGGVTDADADGFDSSSDCDDNDASTFPGAMEICDLQDNNCNGIIDDAMNMYLDADQDGFGDDLNSLIGCELIAGYVATPGDCDDNNASIYPGNGCEVGGCTGASQAFVSQNYTEVLNEGVICFNNIGLDQQSFVSCLTTTYPAIGDGCATCVYEGLSCIVIECENACQQNQASCQDCYDASPCWAQMYACLGIDDPNGGGGNISDQDNDGISDDDENAIGSNPFSADSDGDGINDLIEVIDTLNPADADGDNTFDINDSDDDNDGIPTFDEFFAGEVSLADVDSDGVYNWFDLDSDNDGVNDSVELMNDTNGDAILDFIQSEIN